MSRRTREAIRQAHRPNTDDPMCFEHAATLRIRVDAHASQRTNTKLREVAAELVRTGGLRGRG